MNNWMTAFARIFGIMLAAFAIMGSAQAGQPDHLKFDVTYTDEFFSEHCGFPVEAHVEIVLTSGERNGKFFETGTVNTTFTNEDTGRTVLFRQPYLSVSENLETGELVVTQSGAILITAPGVGTVHVDAGRTIFKTVFDPETGEAISAELLFQSGRHDGGDTVEIICDLLSR